MHIAVLASGSGTLLEAILADGIPVDLVVADRACRAIDVAAAHGVAAELVERESFGAGFDRAAYTLRVADVLTGRGIELVVMAGFGTVFAAPMFERFHGRMLNTHPALLPAFKGWHAVRAALEAGVKVTGCTVHVATLEVDDGPIIAQEAVPVLDGDDETSLHERIKDVERRLYPATIRAVLADPTLLDPSPGDPPQPDRTADPSADRTADPSADPSADRTADPSADRTADPSADRTADPSADPSAERPAGPPLEQP